MKRKKEKEFFTYECSLNGQSYRRTRKAKNPSDLMSVKAYYELNPDKDDRPAVIKKQLGLSQNLGTVTQ